MPNRSAPNKVPTRRKGLSRILHAFNYSISGLAQGWGEPAFKQEACLALVLCPLSFLIGNNWVQVSLLLATVVLVLVVELLNTGIESAIDRMGPEWHALSKRAKDLGSAAVLLSLLLCAGVWTAAVWERYFS